MLIAILEWMIAYFLIPGMIFGVIGLFVWMLISIMRAKKKKAVIPKWKKIVLIVSAAILVTLIVSVVALVIVFMLAIAYM